MLEEKFEMIKISEIGEKFGYMLKVMDEERLVFSLNIILDDIRVKEISEWVVEEMNEDCVFKESDNIDYEFEYEYEIVEVVCLE